MDVRKDLPAILCTALSAIVAGLFVPERLRALPSGVDGLDMVLANVQLHQKTTSPTKRQKTLDLSDFASHVVPMDGKFSQTCQV